MIYTRELYSVVADLGMSSATRAQAKKTHVVEAAHIARVLLDTSWWRELCHAYHTEKDGVIGRRISQVGMATNNQEPLTLEIYSDMSGGGLGAHWKGTALWGYAPMADELTLDRHDTSRIYVSSGYGEAAGILMCLLTFLPLWAIRYPDRPPGTRVLRIPTVGWRYRSGIPRKDGRNCGHIYAHWRDSAHSTTLSCS